MLKIRMASVSPSKVIVQSAARSSHKRRRPLYGVKLLVETTFTRPALISGPRQKVMIKSLAHIVELSGRTKSTAALSKEWLKLVPRTRMDMSTWLLKLACPQEETTLHTMYALLP